MHSYCAISPGGRVSTKATAPDGMNTGWFTPGEGLQAATAEIEPNGGSHLETSHEEEGLNEKFPIVPVRKSYGRNMYPDKQVTCKDCLDEDNSTARSGRDAKNTRFIVQHPPVTLQALNVDG